MATVVVENIFHVEEIKCSSCSEKIEVPEDYSIRVIERPNGTNRSVTQHEQVKYLFCSKECCARWLLEDS
ncbi:hypothetical protein HOT82_gp010 [Gordonia phage Ronaldo]|uniref:Uncharacterized protein n=3 Tax=Ronaldovirus ronaldo TaxID=2734270 RepID=A0A6B9LJY9_9CAUD|nr:hypothetical protein HOT82_gp010 [Gordonia phage Ronaldo]AXN53706.1 hypothetical protein SEA_RONALDO_10 [Gordonia phage Ronaldo]QDH48350.1 hypothetical protein SEA_ZIKO_11 [Gordonia phage Ziko]QHB38264.1 hypothetical protein SEA_VOLT_10 [Gordonia phage Volt]